MKVEVTKEFVLEAYNNACNEWKQRIEKELPELFKDRLEVGKWYKGKYQGLICCTSLNGLDKECFTGYGLHSGEWVGLEDEGSDAWIINCYKTEATKEEVETALITEAKKRGFKKGVKFNSVGLGRNNIATCNPKLLYWYDDDSAYSGISLECGDGTGMIYSSGKWATIIEQVKEVTIEEIQEKYGCKIKIVE